MYEELAGLIRKTAGLRDVLAHALAPLGSRVASAFVYGSVARGSETGPSDVDLMVLGKVSFADVVKALRGVHDVLRREVNPTVMSSDEFERRRTAGDAFVESVWTGPKLWVIGLADEPG